MNFVVGDNGSVPLSATEIGAYHLCSKDELRLQLNKVEILDLR